MDGAPNARKGKAAADMTSSEKPSLEEVVSVFGDRLYGILGGTIDPLHGPGWGRSPGRGGQLKLSSLALQYTLGKDHLSVENTIDRDPLDDAARVWLALGRGAIPRRPTFPFTATVEKARVALEVDGRSRVFTVYSCGGRSSAYAHVAPVSLKIEFPTRLLGRFALEKIGADGARAALQARSRR